MMLRLRVPPHSPLRDHAADAGLPGAREPFCYGSVTLSRSDLAKTSRSSLPEPLLKHTFRRYDSASLSGHWEEDHREGTRWRDIEFPNLRRLVTLPACTCRRSQTQGNGWDGYWLCYPVLCLDGLECCDTKTQWLERHSNELSAIKAKIANPSEGWRPAAFERTVPADSSMNDDYSVFVTEGSATIVTWPGRRKLSFADHLWTVLVVECALLQYWQLRSLLGRLANPDSVGVIRGLQEEVIFGLEEFTSSRLTYGQAVEKMNLLLEGLRVERLYLESAIR